VFDHQDGDIPQKSDSLPISHATTPYLEREATSHVSTVPYCDQLSEVRKVRKGRQHIADACLVPAGEQHSLFRPLTG